MVGQSEQRALAVVTVVLLVSTLALASAPRWAACISSTLAVLAVVPVFGSRRRLAGPHPLLWLLAIPLIATAIQLLPFPSAIVRFVAPATYELAVANARAYGTSSPSFLPLTQDWPATIVELAKFSGYFAFAYICLRLSVSRRASKWLVLTVSVVAVIVALCALGHQALGATSLLGIYRPSISAYTNSLSPFLNPNQLAGYMAFATPLCLGLAVHRKAWRFALMAGICIVAAVLANSRGGTLSLCIGVVVASALFVTAQRRERGRRIDVRLWLPVAVGAIGVGIAILSATAGQELLSVDLQHESESGKLLAWRSAPQLIATSPWIGIGRGAFEHSFTAVQPAIGVTFSHLENEYLQAIVDWGIPTALAMLAGFFVLLRHLFRKRQLSGTTAGGLGALAALACQSAYDFGLEFPGMALPAIAITATLLHPKLAQIAGPRRKKAVGIRVFASFLAVVICALGASSLGARPEQDLKLHPELSAGHSGSTQDVILAAERLSRRHPANYLIHAKAAERLGKARDPQAFPVLARALAQNPNHWGVHLLAARLLETSQEPRQALAEYRAALELPGGARKSILASAGARFPAAEELILVLPAKIETHVALGGVLLGMGRPDVAQLLAEKSLQAGNTAYPIYALGVTAALRSGDTGWATSTAARAHNQVGSNESLLLYVSALRAEGLPLLALDAMTGFTISGATKHGREALGTLCELHLQTLNYQAARAAAEQLLQASMENPTYRRAAHLHLATIEDHSQNHHQATWHRQRAAELRQR